MTNATLASALNEELRLEGRARLSANIIRQWVDWGLLAKAHVAGRDGSGGPKWERDDTAISRAHRFAEMRVYGIHSERALVAQTYLEWRAVPFHRAKPAIVGEFRSARLKLWRTLTATIPDGSVSEFSATKRRALKAQGGPLDPMFRNTQFEIPQSATLSALQSAFGSVIDDAEHSALIGAAMNKMVPSIETQFLAQPLVSLALEKAIFALPDEVEISGTSVLNAADEIQFDQAQKAILEFITQLRRIARGDYSNILPDEAKPLQAMLENLSPQITTGPWLVAGFVQVLMSQVGDNGRINLQSMRQRLLKVQ